MFDLNGYCSTAMIDPRARRDVLEMGVSAIADFAPSTTSLNDSSASSERPYYMYNARREHLFLGSRDAGASAFCVWRPTLARYFVLLNLLV
jgi:hypothetical protein